MVSITCRFKTPREKHAKGMNQHVNKGNMQSTITLGILCMKQQKTCSPHPLHGSSILIWPTGFYMILQGMRQVSFIFLKFHIFFVIPGFTFLISFENNPCKHSIPGSCFVQRSPQTILLSSSHKMVIYFLILNDLLHKIHLWGFRSYAYIFYFAVPHHCNASLREAGPSLVISTIIFQNSM